MVRTGRSDCVYHRRGIGREKKSLAFFWLLSIFISFQLSWAMTPDAHRTVAQLSIHYLDANAQEWLSDILGERWKEEWVAQSVAVELALVQPVNEHLIPFQVTLFDVTDTGFNVTKNCPNNRCSVAAVLESQRVLLLDNFSQKDKVTALSYILHYGVQLHNPIHNGFIADQGGQTIQLKDSELESINLAKVWDEDLYQQFAEHWFTLAQKFRRDITEIQAQQWLTETDPVMWAFESHLLARESVYPLAEEGRFSAQLRAEGQVILKSQLQKAAVRMAGLVNKLMAENVAVP